jgi:hypothetical protein
MAFTWIYKGQVLNRAEASVIQLCTHDVPSALRVPRIRDTGIVGPITAQLNSLLYCPWSGDRCVYIVTTATRKEMVHSNTLGIVPAQRGGICPAWGEMNDSSNIDRKSPHFDNLIGLLGVQGSPGLPTLGRQTSPA